MICVFVIIALCGLASGDVSELLQPSRGYLPPSRQYLPPALPNLLVSSASTPAITTSYQEDTVPRSTPAPIVEEDIQLQSTSAPEVIRTTAPSISDELVTEEKEITSPVSVTTDAAVEKEGTSLPLIRIAPVTDTASVRRDYLPPLPVAPIVPQTSAQNHNLPSIEVSTHSNANQDDSDIQTNIISQPILKTITLPQIESIFTTFSTPTTVTFQPSVVTFVPESSQAPTTVAPTSVPEYIQKTADLPSEDTSESDPLIRINASELSHLDEDISESQSSVVEDSAPETVLSEDGYHYSIPLFSFISQ